MALSCNFRGTPRCAEAPLRRCPPIRTRRPQGTSRRPRCTNAGLLIEEPRLLSWAGKRRRVGQRPKSPNWLRSGPVRAGWTQVPKLASLRSQSSSDDPGGRDALRYGQSTGRPDLSSNHLPAGSVSNPKRVRSTIPQGTELPSREGVSARCRPRPRLGRPPASSGRGVLVHDRQTFPAFAGSDDAAHAGRRRADHGPGVLRLGGIHLE
jgi:hypothetical protein